MTRASCDVREEELVWMSDAMRERLWDMEDPRVVSVVVNANRASSVRWAEEEEGGGEAGEMVGDVVVSTVVVVGLETAGAGEDVVMMAIDWIPEDEVMYSIG